MLNLPRIEGLRKHQPSNPVLDTRRERHHHYERGHGKSRSPRQRGSSVVILLRDCAKEFPDFDIRQDSNISCNALRSLSSWRRLDRKASFFRCLTSSG